VADEHDRSFEAVEDGLHVRGVAGQAAQRVGDSDGAVPGCLEP
jgi:hypothetical protein